MATLDELHAHLTDLLPVLRALNEATAQLAAALPGPAQPVLTTEPLPTVDEAMAAINAAIDDYCSVSLRHSGLVTDPESSTN